MKDSTFGGQHAPGLCGASLLSSRSTLGADGTKDGAVRRRPGMFYVATVCFLSAVIALLIAAPRASAASPWWHLTSGSRPANIHPGSGKPGATEVQEILVETEEEEGFAEQAWFTLGVEPEEEVIEGTKTFISEPLCATYCGGENVLLTTANIQAALERPEDYGPGNVTIEEVSIDKAGNPLPVGDLRWIVTAAGALEEEAIGPLFAGRLVGTAHTSVITEGKPVGPDGTVVVFAENLGDAPVKGSTSPVTITDVLPHGLTATAVHAVRPASANTFLALPCRPLPELSCTLPADLAPYQQFELRIGVDVNSEASEAPGAEINHVQISGGGAAAASLARPLRISTEPTPFGIEDYESNLEEEGGGPALDAGTHPFQFTTSVILNQGEEVETPGGTFAPKPSVSPAFLPKDIDTGLPVGLIGDPSPFPTCTLAQFGTLSAGGPGSLNPEENGCPASTVVGVTTVTIEEPLFGYITATVPLFNLEPSFGEPARFGFAIPIGHTTVSLDAALRDGPGEDYGLTVKADDITQQAGTLAAQVTVWGVPGDPVHDASRGWSCLFESFNIPNLGHGPCQASTDPHPPAFLTMPTSCTGPLQSSVLAASWLEPAIFHQYFPPEPLQALGACNQVPFAPTIHSEPTSNAATSPTGLNFDLNFANEGLTNSNPGARAESNVKKAVVTLPQGFTTNPSVAEGLKACSLAEYEAAAVAAGTGCNQESKIGEVEIESPAIETRPERVVKGGLFVARQGENPSKDAQHPNGNLLTLYLIARAPELGIIVKQPLKVVPDPVTGQLTTEVDNIPQLPFSHFHLSFRQGQRSPLVTPPACGEYTVNALLFPYSAPSEPLHRESSFRITAGPEGQGCPSGGVPPFHPALEAGTLNNSAGTYSPFVTHITRKDSEQEITRFSIKLPTGLIAKLKGVSECTDAQIAQAKSREVEGGGTVEQENPSCPANSEIGHSLVGSGVGNVLAYAPGKLYFAGPYHGSPISIVSITAAKVGPFDLGTVVVRFALDVNHETAEVSVDGANSDPIPHIVDGIPIHLRDIRAYVDRSNFTLNPTSCAKKSTAATVLGSGLNFASSSDDVPVTVSSPFQAADCASLGFKPKLALNLVGKKTHRGALPAFKAVLTYPKGGAYANIAKAQVTLPSSEFLEQGHLKNVCTRKVFETGANPGENCPKNSIYGKARAVTPLLDQPLEGPVYLRTGYGTKLPELAAALNGPQISVTLAGTIDSIHQKGTEGSRIRNTFALVPDAPVERFVLELKGGKKGLLVNSTDVCKGTHKALAAFTGQNGKIDEYEPALTAQCGKGKKKSGKKKNGGGKGKGGK
jgi:hypothetical protein